MTDYWGWAYGEYPTEQQGMSNIQVNGNINGDVSDPMPFDALDDTVGDSVGVNFSSNEVQSLSSAVAVTWILDIPCCSVGY
jgi:hypothetical protein